MVTSPEINFGALVHLLPPPAGEAEAEKWRAGRGWWGGGAQDFLQQQQEEEEKWERERDGRQNLLLGGFGGSGGRRLFCLARLLGDQGEHSVGLSKGGERIRARCT